jgi:hypothetical protein
LACIASQYNPFVLCQTPQNSKQARKNYQEQLHQIKFQGGDKFGKGEKRIPYIANVPSSVHSKLLHTHRQATSLI